MKLAALAVALLALGIVLGLALAGGVSEGPASAEPKCPGPSANCTPTPAPPQQREDQVVIFAQEGAIAGRPDFGPIEGSSSYMIGFDPADYPSSSTFRFEATWTDTSPFIETCVRLLERDTRTNIAESEVCHTAPLEADFREVRIRSAPFTLPVGEHNYKIQGRCLPAPCNSTIGSARIIVEWTE